MRLLSIAIALLVAVAVASPAFAMQHGSKADKTMEMQKGDMKTQKKAAHQSKKMKYHAKKSETSQRARLEGPRSMQRQEY
ncbi:MAG: hypothetical protein AB7G80_00665 [Dongiaceae bacterium]